MDCREAFERSECEKYGNNYDDMKKNWDWYESQYGWRYPGDSPRGKSWVVWQKAWQHRQTEVDELQRRNQMLNDNVKEQGQKLVYQNEVIETQAEKLLGLRDESAELQKRVDAVKQLIQDYKQHSYREADDFVFYLEQALKGSAE